MRNRISDTHHCCTFPVYIIIITYYLSTPFSIANNSSKVQVSSLRISPHPPHLTYLLCCSCLEVCCQNHKSRIHCDTVRQSVGGFPKLRQPDMRWSESIDNFCDLNASTHLDFTGIEMGHGQHRVSNP